MQTNKQSWWQILTIDHVSVWLGKLLTSTTLVIIVMLAFLIGIAEHLHSVFDSWFLAVSVQSIVLVTAVNSNILPHWPITIGKSNYKLPVITIVLSLFMTVFIFQAFHGFDFWRGFDPENKLYNTELPCSDLLAMVDAAQVTDCQGAMSRIYQTRPQDLNLHAFVAPTLLALAKALCLAAIEFMLSYIFAARWAAEQKVGQRLPKLTKV